MSQFIRMEAKGIATDIHERFPITFNYGQSGTAYFNGCRLEAVSDNGNFTRRMDIQAFGDNAEALASVTPGVEVHVKGFYDQRKGKDEKYYPILTVDEVISIG